MTRAGRLAEARSCLSSTATRGLELSPTKTVITHVMNGFDFLGQNVRRYPNGKLLIKPSKKNIKTFLDGIRRTVKAALGMSAADLIKELNPKIRGWANYHRHVASKRVFNRVDHAIFYCLWQWARRRHPNKDPRWLKQKYFERHRGHDWFFFGETCDEEGKPIKVRLLLASRIPIKRHVKVRSEANPYDPAYAATWKAVGNDCLTRRTDQTAHLIARSLRGRSGEATDRSKPSDNVPTSANLAPEPRGDGVSASIRRRRA